MDIGYMIMHLAKELRYNLNKQLESVGITAQQWAVLKHVELAERPITAAHVSHALGIDYPTMSGIVRRLIVKELLQQEKNEADKRSTFILLTGKAQQMIPQYEAISQVVLTEQFRLLSSTEEAQLKNLLNRAMNR